MIPVNSFLLFYTRKIFHVNYLLFKAVVVGDIQDVLCIIEGRSELGGPLLQGSPLPRRDPVSLLHQLRHPRDNPGLQVLQPLGFVEADELQALAEEPGGDRRRDPPQR